MIWRDLYMDAIASLKKQIQEGIELGASGTVYMDLLYQKLEKYTIGLRLVEEELGL